jgi:hypothetical protein
MAQDRTGEVGFAVMRMRKLWRISRMAVEEYL